VADSGSGTCNVTKTLNVVANDTDPGGRYPLSVVSVTSTSNVSASVANSTSVFLTGYSAGTDTLSYVVQNTAGITAAGTITYTTTGSARLCNQ